MFVYGANDDVLVNLKECLYVEVVNNSIVAKTKDGCCFTLGTYADNDQAKSVFRGGMHCFMGHEEPLEVIGLPNFDQNKKETEQC